MQHGRPQRRMTMSQATRTLFIASLTMLMQIATVHAQAQRGGRGAPQGGPPAAIGRGGAAPAPTPPKPLIANAKPVRSCESLATISFPNTTVESAAVDSNNPGICRVTAITTHPPTGDKVKITAVVPASARGEIQGDGQHGRRGEFCVRHRILSPIGLSDATFSHRHF
jgi:hypothetical protein